MSSSCTNDGSYNLTVTFKHGVDLNMAQVLVQNRVSLALPSLPDVIKQTGVTVKKRSPDILMGIAITSPDGRYDQLYLSNYALMQLKDELARVEASATSSCSASATTACGSGSIRESWPMRNLTAGDVVQRDSRAKRAGGDRHRSASRRCDGDQEVRNHAQHARPAGRGRAIREHHPQGRRPTAGSCGSRTSAGSSWARRIRTST